MSKHQAARSRRTRGVTASFIAAALGFTGLVALATSSSAVSEPGSSAENPIIHASPDLEPDGAATDGPYPNQCAQEQTWVLTGTHDESRYKRTVPAVDEVSHTEYRWAIEQRTYDPGQQEVSHQVYSYKKTVQDFRTKYQYQKQTKTTVRHGNSGPYVLVSDWSWWSPASTQWSFDNVEVLESGNHANWTQNHQVPGPDHTDYFDRDYRYVKNGVTQQVPNGSHQEYSGEVLAPLGAPWVLLGGYPKTVIDVAAVPASFSGWTFKEFTPWQSSATPPADPDGQSGANNPLNLQRIQAGSQESKTVITVEAKDAYTEYYVLDGTPSLNEDDASWLTDDQEPVGDGWTVFDEQTVTDKVTYYFWTDGEECIEEQPREIDPAVYTEPTCTTPGTLVGVDTVDYVWVPSGFPTAATLPATSISDAELIGETVYGPYDLTQLSGEECLSEQPPIETLAQTGFPLLGLLGLAGSLSLIGGGLLGAGRLRRNRH